MEPAPKKAKAKAKAKAPKKPAAPKPAAPKPVPAAAPAPGQVPGIHVIKVAKRPSPAGPPAGGRVLKRPKKAAGGPAAKPKPARAAAAAAKPQKKAPPPPPGVGESDEETVDERPPPRASDEAPANGTRSPFAARAALPPPPEAPREAPRDAPRGPAERPGPGPGDLRLELQSPSKPYGQHPPAPVFTAFGRAPPPPPPGPAQDTSGFYELRAQYRELEQKYKDLKNAKISHVKAILNEQSDNIAKHSEASAKLAHVWREEAERQAALGEMQSGRLQELEREVGRLREEHGREKEELRQRVEQSKQGSASLDYLTGFTAEAIEGSEGFTYTHPDSGFKFMLRPAAEVFQDDDDEGDLENEDLGYVPLEFGTLEKGLLPGYLADEITIPGRQKARLFSIMFAKLTDPKARDAIGGGAAAGGGAPV